MRKSYKKWISATVSSVLVASTMSPIIPAAQVSQSQASHLEVSAENYYDLPVKNLAARGILDIASFKPNAIITRGQAAKMLAIMLDLKIENVKDPGFKDVPKQNEAFPYIAVLANQGILKGYGDVYKPDEPLTRAQMAKILTLAFQLTASPLTDKRFSDVQSESWYANYVQVLIEHNITLGTSPTTFSPHQQVKLAQMATFLYRSEQATKAITVQAVVSDIKNNQLVTNRGSYTLSESLTTWLNTANLEVFKGANLSFQSKKQVVEKINSVEITASGKPAGENEAEFSRNLLFDAKGATITGDLKVSGDYISFKDATIMGNLEISRQLENDFHMDNVTVHGLVKVDGGDSNTVVFANSTLGQVEVSKHDVRVEYLGNTLVQSIALTSNATIVSDDKASISQITFLEGAKQVSLQASVDTLNIATPESISIKGTSNVNQLVVNSSAPVALDLKGQIQSVSVTQKDANLSLGTNMQIQNLVVPSGVTANQVVQNYATVQSQITNINGTTNLAAIPAPTNNPPVQANPVPTKTITLGDEPLTVDISNVFRDADADQLTITAISRAETIATVQLTGNLLKITPVKAGIAVIQLTASDGKASAVSRFNVNVNSRPVAINIPDATFTLGEAEQILDLSEFFTDPDKDNLSYTVTSIDGTSTTASVVGKILTMTAVAAGTTEITITAADGKGGTISKTFAVHVNRAPIAIANIADQLYMLNAGPQAIDLTGLFLDEDGDVLTLTALSADETTVTASILDRQLTVTPKAAGQTTIKVTATDGRGGKVEQSFNVTINTAPITANPVTDQLVTLGKADLIVDLSDVFHDEQGDLLELSAISKNLNLAEVQINGTLLTIQPLARGIATIEVTANDGKGGTVVETFTVRINEAPIGTNLSNQTVSIGSSDKTVNLSNVFTDADGDVLTIEVASSNEQIAKVELLNGILTIKAISLGTSLVTVTASDSFGGSVAKTFEVTVQPNQAPVILQSIGDQTMGLGNGVPIDLSNVFRDPDGDTLTYSAVSSDETVASVSISGDQLIFKGMADGVATITVTAEDVAGNSVNTTFLVNVVSNEAPIVVGTISEQVIGLGVAANKFNIDQLFSDANGDPLTYTVTAADSQLVLPVISGNQLTLTPGVGSGKTKVTITAHDGKGGTVSTTVDVFTVSVVHTKQIVTKKGASDIAYDVAAVFPTQNGLSVYRQQQGSLTQSGKETLSGKLFRTIPGTVGLTDYYWVVAEDGTAAFIEVSVQEQLGAGVFFSEYTKGPDGRIALEIYNANESAINYQVVGYRYNTKTNRMEVMNNTDIPQKPFVNVMQVYPGTLGIVINHTFYDLMDISPVQYYHGELQMMTGANDGYIICAFELLKNGQVIDVLGDKNWTPNTEQNILTKIGTMVRKTGIKTGSTTFNLEGEFDQQPLTYMNLFTHKP